LKSHRQGKGNMGRNVKTADGGCGITGDVRGIPRSALPLDVLVVDDEPLIRWAISETLAAAGHHVDQAVDAASALGAIRAADRPIDVVLLDLCLPDSRDLNLLRAIRRLTPGSAVILMTAMASPELIDGARCLGAVDVMPKPFEMGQLESAVQDAHRSRSH
jgi:DNA-binding NtrC family response regulator